MPAPKDLDPSASLSALYGVKLRKLRIRAGLTQRQLGDKIPMAHSRIAQFELGKETPPEDVNTKLDTLLGADGDLVDLWGHIRRTPIPDWARKFMEYEARATAMHKYVAQAVPGLLQIEAYARALLRISRPRDTDAEIQELVTTRLERQAILHRGAPPLLWCVLDEAVLRRPVGGHAVMREQLAYILHMAWTPHVVVQVLSFRQGEHIVMGGSLTLLRSERGSDVAYTESSHSGELVETSEEVAEYALAYDLLQAKALPPDESLAMVRSAMEGVQHMRAAPADLSNARWRKSTYSNGQGGDCLEFADNVPSIVPVRDSKNPTGPVLLFPPAAWSAFIVGIRRLG